MLTNDQKKINKIEDRNIVLRRKRRNSIIHLSTHESRTNLIKLELIKFLLFFYKQTLGIIFTTCPLDEKWKLLYKGWKEDCK